MTVSEIYELINYVSNKNKSGNAYNIDEYNKMLESVNRPFFKKKIEEFEYYRKRGESPPNQALLNTKLVRELKRIEQVTVGANDRVNLSVGGDLTHTFAYFISCVGYWGARRRKIDLVSDEEYQIRFEDTVIGYEDEPVCTIAESRLYFSWNRPSYPVEIAYYSFPANPFCDYYIDTNGVMQYLAAGATHAWATGEIDSSGTTHTLGDPNWTSLTVELVYNEDIHFDFMMELASMAGVKLEKPLVTQYAEGMKQESRAL